MNKITIVVVLGATLATAVGIFGAQLVQPVFGQTCDASSVGGVAVVGSVPVGCISVGAPNSVFCVGSLTSILCSGQ